MKDEYIMETISIPIVYTNCMYPHQKHNILVNAETKDRFALHQSFETLKGDTDEPFYTVTHIPTKGVLLRHDNYKACKNFIDEICVLDWSILDRNDCPESCNAKYSKETGKEIFKDYIKFTKIKSKYL